MLYYIILCYTILYYVMLQTAPARKSRRPRGREAARFEFIRSSAGSEAAINNALIKLILNSNTYLLSIVQ